MQIALFFISTIIFIFIFIWFVYFIIEKNKKLISGIYRGQRLLICIILGYPVWAAILLSNEIVKNYISISNLVVVILLPLIVSTVLGILLQKFLHKIFKSKYYIIHLFPLVLILLCLLELILTMFILIIVEYNHTIKELLVLEIGIFLASLFFSSKIVSKRCDEDGKIVK